jgi:hypothetical protein
MAVGSQALCCSNSTDHRHLAIFLCPCCRGNRVVKLFGSLTSLETVFPGVDFTSEGVWTFLVVSSSHSGDGDAKAHPLCIDWTHVQETFGSILDAVSMFFESDVNCVVSNGSGSRDEQDRSSGRGAYNKYGCGAFHKDCVPVFSFGEIKDLVTVERWMGTVVGEGSFISFDDESDGELDEIGDVGSSC